MIGCSVDCSYCGFFTFLIPNDWKTCLVPQYTEFLNKKVSILWCHWALLSWSIDIRVVGDNILFSSTAETSVIPYFYISSICKSWLLSLQQLLETLTLYWVTQSSQFLFYKLRNMGIFSFFNYQRYVFTPVPTNLKQDNSPTVLPLNLRSKYMNPLSDSHLK